MLDRRLVAAVWICVLAAASACSTRSSKLLVELDQVKSAAAAERATGEVGLAECIARASSVGPTVSRASIASLLERAQLDDVASRADLLGTVSLSYGTSVVGQPPQEFSASEAIQWDPFRYYQYRHVERYRESSAVNESRMLELARKQAALETVQAFFEYALARRREALIVETLEPRRRELAVLSGAEEPATARRRKALTQELAALERRRLAAGSLAAQRRLQLDRLAHLAPQAVIVPALPEAPAAEDMDSLASYLAAATQDTPPAERAELQRKLAGDVADVTRKSKWTNLVTDITFLDLFERTTTPLAPPLRWSLALLDGGRHDRELLKARADALLAELKVDDSAHQAASLAVRAWFDLAERKIAYRQQRARTDQARIGLWASEERADAPASVQRQRRQELAEQEIELAAQQQALVLAHMQFELLRNEGYEQWLQASLGEAGTVQ